MEKNEVATIHKMLEHEIMILELTKRFETLSQTQYKDGPYKPVCQSISIPYPVIPKLKHNWVIIIAMGIVFSPLLLVYAFWWYPQKRDQHYEEIKNSEQYKQQCLEIDAEVKRRQAIENENYAKALEKFDADKAVYDSERSKWESEKSELLNEINNDRMKASAELADIYQSTMLIPTQYRNIEALTYIHDILSSADFSVQQAIDLYDRDRQMKLEVLKLQRQEEANRLAENQNAIAAEQAALMGEQNEIAAKTRRDQNIAAVVAGVQRHSLNKTVKDFTKGRKR